MTREEMNNIFNEMITIIKEEEDTEIAKAFTMNIIECLKKEGIKPIMIRLDYPIETRLSANEYKIISRYRYMLEKVDTSEHDKQIRNVALDDLVKLVWDYYTMQEKAGYCADTNNMIKQRISDFAEQIKEKHNE